MTASEFHLYRSLIPTENEPRLDAKSIEVELSFVLVAGETRSAAVEAQVVSVGAASAVERTSSNTVALKYENPEHATEDNEARPIPP